MKITPLGNVLKMYPWKKNLDACLRQQLKDRTRKKNHNEEYLTKISVMPLRNT